LDDDDCDIMNFCVRRKYD